MKRGIIFTKLSASLLAGGCMLCIPVKTTAQGILKQVARSAAQRTASTAINKTLGVSATKDTVILPGAQAIQTNSFTPVESYSQYDFVPGQSVLFLEDFSNASIGELPLGWNSNGSGVAVTVSNAPGKWLKLGQQSVYLAPNKLPAGENFTIEFDLILQFKKSGAKGFPVVRFGALSTLKGIAPADNSLLRTQEGKTKFQVILQPDEKQKSSVMLESWKAGKYHISEAFKRYPGIESTYGKVAHIAIQVQRERLRIWYNGDKLYELPKGIAPEGAFNQLFFSLGSSSYTEQEQGVYISNIKMANGLADTRKNLLDKGSYSTTGILFDVNSAHIQPASSGVLNELAGILQENPEMKVKVTGHTDADGEVKVSRHSKALAKLREKEDPFSKSKNGSLFEYKIDKLTTPEEQPLRFTGKTAVLIGTETFSSANMLANTIKDYKLATLIGEPTAEPGNDFGEVFPFMLPNTRVIATGSIKMFVRANGDASDFTGIQPDIFSATDIGDKRKDQVMEDAMKYLGNK